ncbi:winged helix-turn-helix transcriptional regulator [Pseudomonas sp. R1-6]|uniref:winged helix-turn-helix transcriptional regulator n=1 Tax=Pseudomonas sp. R1-6 TaxID=2817397 RepID=UPI003DA9F222
MSWPGIIRDIVFTGKKTYGQFLKSEEGIATNVLASRLAFLKEEGVLSKAPNPDDRRKDFYELTEKGIRPYSDPAQHRHVERQALFAIIRAPGLQAF